MNLNGEYTLDKGLKNWILLKILQNPDRNDLITFHFNDGYLYKDSKIKQTKNLEPSIIQNVVLQV